jgi:hypothetical protein
MSILADSLGPSYPSGAPSSLQEGQDPMPIALFPETGRRRHQPQAHPRKGIQAHAEKKSQPTVRHDEALVSDIPTDSSFDIFSGLVDFEQSAQSPDDEDSTSRNNQAPVDFDANFLLSNYESLFDAQPVTTTTPTSSAFSAIF